MQNKDRIVPVPRAGERVVEMLKGVNKKVVEVTNPENEYFERVIFFLKDSARGDSESQITQRAAQYIDLACRKPQSGGALPLAAPRKKRKLKNRWKRLAVAAGAVLLVLCGTVALFLF